MKRWIDVDPLDWYYRDTLEITRLRTDLTGDVEVLSGMTYNVFKEGYERMVKRFVTVSGQQEFLVPDYKYHVNNPVFVIVNGVEVLPEKVENGKVTMTNPLSAGIEVVVIAYGIPDRKDIGCVNTPYNESGDYRMPHATLKYASTYHFSYSNQPESCTVLGVKLKRLLVTVGAGSDAGVVIRNAIGFQRDVFVIHKGEVYLPYMYNGFPAVIGYNAVIKKVSRRTSETVVVESGRVTYNDRFFGDVRIRRGDFFALMSRIYENLHNRYTDRVFTYNDTPLRPIVDKDVILSKWYSNDVLTLLDEKFHDGCYVFPLYEDGKFEPEACITRAEAVTFLNRLIEWITEKYR
ncbi:S-layer homology domain-containing protein [Paenibacillus amylolyticus]|uniref:S-layer homology domain-containing protein n=1 Tax=Paenibacillus amylolyticus TaxID=1451 RepID=UPI003EBB5A62